MQAEEFRDIHLALWSNPPPVTITYRGDSYPVVIRNDQDRNFRSVHIADKTVITQNLHKPSPNTRWCLEEPGRKMTWIIRDGGGYIARAETHVRDDREVTELYTLSPEVLVEKFEGK